MKASKRKRVKISRRGMVGALEVRCHYDYARNDIRIDFEGVEELERCMGTHKVKRCR